MATFQTVAEIERAISKGLTALKTDERFIKGLKSELQKAIYDKVYSVPQGLYTRRYNNGGLGDMENMKSSSERLHDIVYTDDDDFMVMAENVGTYGAVAAISVEIVDIAPPEHEAPYDLDYMVENGIGRGNMAYPRPFYATASDYVQEYSDLYEAIAATVIEEFL